MSQPSEATTAATAANNSPDAVKTSFCCIKICDAADTRTSNHACRQCGERLWNFAVQQRVILVQMLITTIAVIFSMAMLAKDYKNEKASSNSFYQALLFSLITIWFPAPYSKLGEKTATTAAGSNSGEATVTRDTNSSGSAGGSNGNVKPDVAGGGANTVDTRNARDQVPTPGTGADAASSSTNADASPAPPPNSNPLIAARPVWMADTAASAGHMEFKPQKTWYLFLFQTALTLTGIGFCIGMLIAGAIDRTVYQAFMWTLITIWIPSPSPKAEAADKQTGGTQSPNNAVATPPQGGGR